MKRPVLLFILLLSLSAFFGGGGPAFRVPSGWPEPAYDFARNPPQPAAIMLGRALFYDPLLSRDSSISCASCHLQYTAFAHVDHKLSHGIDDRIGTRNAPALVNLAWQKNFMWDGAVHHLDMQALAPITNKDEMDEDPVRVLAKLRRSALYPRLFRRAFGDTAITGERMLKAISQFMLSLVSCNARYDSVQRGEASFTPQEQSGYQLFVQHCSSCHTPPLFSNGGFENNGLAPDLLLADAGRMKVMQNPGDAYKFKVPTLRNVEFSYPYMHDGRFSTLYQVLDHYGSPPEPGPTLSPLLGDISLSPAEKTDLVAFLLTLTDRSFLFDRSHSYPGEIFFTPPKD